MGSWCARWLGRCGRSFGIGEHPFAACCACGRALGRTRRIAAPTQRRRRGVPVPNELNGGQWCALDAARRGPWVPAANLCGGDAGAGAQRQAHGHPRRKFRQGDPTVRGGRLAHTTAHSP